MVKKKENKVRSVLYYNFIIKRYLGRKKYNWTEVSQFTFKMAWLAMKEQQESKKQFEPNLPTRILIRGNRFPYRFILAKNIFTILAGIFCRKGLRHKAFALVWRVFLAAYIRRAEKFPGARKRFVASSFRAFHKLAIKAIDRLGLPLKLVPRFVKKRVRKIPVPASISFHRHRLWRVIYTLGHIAYGQAANRMAEELLKVMLRHKTSLVLSKMPTFYKDVDKAKVYLRKIRVVPPDYLPAYKKIKKIIRKGPTPKDAKNKKLLNLLVLKHLKKEPKHIRYFKSRQKVLKKKLYTRGVYRSSLYRILNILYGYELNPTKLMHA